MPPHASSLQALGAAEEFEGAVLDIGCGSGFLALNAALSCERVVGIDLNPRCVRLAQANGLLNNAQAGFVTADFEATSVYAGTAAFDSLIFNTPTSPQVDDEEGEFGRTTAQQILRKVAAVAPKVLRSGGTAFVLALVEVPEQFGSAADAVQYWLSDAGIHDVSIAEIDAPQLSITRAQLQARRLHGQSFLARSAAHGDLLLSALARRAIGSVQVAMIEIRVP
jgi:methylase of polypeptide subunit release factors